jgi:hypothetical protein
MEVCTYLKKDIFFVLDLALEIGSTIERENSRF